MKIYVFLFFIIHSLTAQTNSPCIELSSAKSETLFVCLKYCSGGNLTHDMLLKHIPQYAEDAGIPIVFYVGLPLFLESKSPHPPYLEITFLGSLNGGSSLSWCGILSFYRWCSFSTGKIIQHSYAVVWSSPPFSICHDNQSHAAEYTLDFFKNFLIQYLRVRTN
jgi:hypothetical protein